MSNVPNSPAVQSVHSNAWVIQTWLSWVLAVGVTAMGIWFLPVDGWMKAFLGMGVVFSVGSTFSLAKTVRDQHEQQRIVMSRFLAEVDPISSKR